MKKETVGKLSTDLIIQSKDNSHSAYDQMTESLTDYEKNIFKCIESHKAQYPRDFYVVVITKKEPLMQNVIRNYFLARSTCPTPDYDQTVYLYNKLRDDVEFLWTLPAKDICKDLITDALLIPDEEKELLGYVLSFSDGTLFRLAKRLNGEQMIRGGILEE